MQSPSSYGSYGYRVEPPPATEGKVRCPVCWKAVKLVQRSGFGGRRIPTHNYDHDMMLVKKAAFEVCKEGAIMKEIDAAIRGQR